MSRWRRVGRLLIPGMLAVAVVFYRFPTTERMHWEELSHYLGAVQRVLDGQALVTQVKFMFAPAQISLITWWMGTAGYNLGALAWFFVIGWYLYLLLFGVVVCQCSRNLALAAVICVIFASLWLVDGYDILNSWGGPRYVPGILMLALFNQLSFSEKAVEFDATIHGIAGFFLPLSFSASPEQVTIVVFAWVAARLITRDWSSVQGPTTSTLIASRSTPFILGSLLGIALLLPGHRFSTLVQYLVELPSYSSWRQPITEHARVLATIAVLLTIPGFAVLILYARRHQRQRFSATERAIVTFGIFAALQFVYALRAFQYSQGVMATGFILVLMSCILQQAWKAKELRPIVGSVAMFYAVCSVLLRSEARAEFASHASANFSGVAVHCSTGCRESRWPRLSGVLLPVRDADALDALLTGVRNGWRESRDSTFLVFPEDAFLEFALNRSGESRFPIAAVAATTAEWRKEIFDSVVARPPSIVVRRTQLGLFARSIGSRSELLPELGGFILNNYSVVATAGSFEVLTRTHVR